jgi:hypothetical protein
LKKYQQRNKKHRHATDLEDFGEASSTQVPRFGAKQAQCSLFLAIKMSSEIDKYISRVFLLRLLKSFHDLPVPSLLVAASSLTESLFFRCDHVLPFGSLCIYNIYRIASPARVCGRCSMTTRQFQFAA